MKIIHTADLHIESPIKGPSAEHSRERRREILHTFGTICQRARDNSVDAVIVSGDLFDKSTVGKSSLQYVIACIKRSAPIVFLYLRGNHDEKDAFDGFELPENLVILSDGKCPVDFSDDVVVYSFESSDSLVACPPLDEKNFNIVMYHGDLGPIATDISNKNIDYLALGHYHGRDFGSIDRRGMWLYPGCPNGRGYDECGEKSVELLEICDHNLSHMPIMTFDRLYHDVHISADNIMSNYELSEALAAKLVDIPRDDCVRVEFEGRADSMISPFSPLVREVLSDFFDFKIVDSTRVSVSDAEIGSLSLRGKFVELIRESEADDSVKELAIKYAFAALSGEEMPR